MAHNLKIQHVIDVREDKLDVEELPSHLVDLPFLQDHHFGQYINDIATAVGCTEQNVPFKNLKSLAKDTGEDFLRNTFMPKMIGINMTKQSLILLQVYVDHVAMSTFMTDKTRQPLSNQLLF